MHAHNPSPFNASEKTTANDAASSLTSYQLQKITQCSDVMSALQRTSRSCYNYTLNIHDWDNFST